MKTRKNSGFVFGVALILLGAVLLIMKFANFNMNWQMVWPMIIIAVGLFLLAGVSKNRGVVFPASIVIGVGILFLVHNSGIVPYGYDVLWPFFAIIVGLAFVILYFADRQDTGVLIPASILLAVGAVSLSINFKGLMLYIIPSVIILIGILIMLKVFFVKDGNRYQDGFFDDRDKKADFRQSSESEDRTVVNVPVDYINEDEESSEDE